MSTRNLVDMQMKGTAVAAGRVGQEDLDLVLGLFLQEAAGACANIYKTKSNAGRGFLVGRKRKGGG